MTKQQKYNCLKMCLPVNVAFEADGVDVVAVIVGHEILRQAVVEVPELFGAGELDGGADLQRVAVDRRFQDGRVCRN